MFEQMMDKLERSSGQTVVTLGEAKLLLERQDDLVIAVYDYWLNKRLKTVCGHCSHGMLKWAGQISRSFVDLMTRGVN